MSLWGAKHRRGRCQPYAKTYVPAITEVDEHMAQIAALTIKLILVIVAPGIRINTAIGALYVSQCHVYGITTQPIGDR